MEPWIILLVLTATALGLVAGWLLGRAGGATDLARAGAERDLLAERLA